MLSSARNSIIGSIQHDLVVVIVATSTFMAQSAVALMLGSLMNSTLICRGMSSVIVDASVAKHAYFFLGLPGSHSSY